MFRPLSFFYQLSLSKESCKETGESRFHGRSHFLYVRSAHTKIDSLRRGKASQFRSLHLDRCSLCGHIRDSSINALIKLSPVVTTTTRPIANWTPYLQQTIREWNGRIDCCVVFAYFLPKQKVGARRIGG